MRPELVEGQPAVAAHLMTLYRASVLDTPGDPFADGPAALASESDAAIVVRDGVITARGSYAEVAPQHPDEEVVDLRGGVLLPGLIDTHVHYPQVRAIAGLGMPLLDWLEKCALPEEAKLADDAYAQAIADEFLAGLIQAGHDHGAGLRRALRHRDGHLLRHGRAQQAADHRRSGAQRPDAPCRSADHPRHRAGRGPQADRALARRRPAALCGDPAVLVVGLGGDARGLAPS